MMLGDMLAQARRSVPGFSERLRAADPGLAAEAEAAAAREGVDPATFARAAVAAFALEARDEDWTTLSSRLRDCPDPGAECLRVMLRRRIGASRPGGPRTGPAR